ncbi:hypothetical protein JCM5350_005568 [Sporobolomyces pararoseus]
MNSASTSPIPSPLKRVNASGVRPKSKIASEWEKWSSTPDYLVETGQDPIKYYREFFCLKPNNVVQREAVARLTRDELLGSHKSNVSLLFMTAVELLQIADGDSLIRSNILRTLSVLVRDVLERDYENPSQNIVSILVGEPKNVESTFTDLVAALDSMIRDTESDPGLRHAALQFTLLLVSTLSTSNLASYFLRRDLFSGLVSFIIDEKTKKYAFDASLLIGLLAGYREVRDDTGDEQEQEKGEVTKNPYSVRIEDFIEEATMTRIIDLITTVLLRSRDAYLSIQDDSPPSVVSSVASFVYNLPQYLNLSNSFNWNLPSLPISIPITVSSIPATVNLNLDFKGKGRVGDDQKDRSSMRSSRDVWTATPTPDVSTPGSIHSFVSETTSIQSPHLLSSSNCRSPSHRPLLQKKISKSGEDDPFYELPSEELAILSTCFEFWSLNRIFASLIFSATEANELPTTLISLSSYIFTHASTSRRSQIYARMCLELLMMVVENGEGKLSQQVESDKVRMCRQRQPILPYPDSEEKRQLMASLLDSVVLYLRHNLKRRFDLESYTIALRLLKRIIQQVKSEGVTLEYDWMIVWKSIINLSSYVVTQIRELRAVSGEQVDRLISQVFITLSYAIFWSEHFLPCRFAQAQFYYELLQSEAILTSLSNLLGNPTISTVPSTTEPDDLTASPPRLKDVDPVSPLPKFEFPSNLNDLTSTGSFASSRIGGVDLVVTKACISNLQTALSYFQNVIKLRTLSLLDSDLDPEVGEVTLEPHEILKVIESNLTGVEFVENIAMGDMGKGGGDNEEERMKFKEELMVVVREDTKRLLEQRKELHD